MHNYAEWADFCPDEDLEQLRELLSYDVRCPYSYLLTRSESNCVVPLLPAASLHWSRHIEWPWVLRNAFLESHHKVLDVGSSWSVLKYIIANRCREVVCVDNSQLAVDNSLAAVKHFGYENIICEFADACALPYPNNSFDRVVSVSVLEHIESGWQQAVRECVRVLKPGGCFVLTVDICLEGSDKGNFYIGREGAVEILNLLDIAGTCNNHYTIGAGFDENVKLAVLMMRHVKGGV